MGFGTFIYPPVYFIRKWDRKPEDVLSVFEQQSINFKFNRYNIYVTYDGFIASDCENIIKALDILNCISFSIALLRYRVHAINLEELDIVKIDTTRNTLSVHNVQIKSIRSIFHIRCELRSIFNQAVGSVVISKKDIINILDFADEVYKSDLKDDILRFYEAYTLLQTGNLTPSFVLSWFVIEFFVNIKLRGYIAQKHLSRSISKKLLSKRMESKIEYCKEKGILTKQECKDFNRLRRIRNKVVHHGYRPNRRDVRSAKSQANKIMWKILRLSRINYTQYLAKME